MTGPTEQRTARVIPAAWTSAHPRQERARALAEVLRAQILDGDFAVGDRLDEAELATRHTASRNAVRDALAVLRSEGLIARKRGAGTTVAQPRYGHGLDRLEGLGETLAGYGTVRNEVLDARRVHELPARVAAQLGVETSTGGVRLERLRRINDGPLSWDVSYLTADVGAALLSADLIGTDVFTLIEQTSGSRLGRAEVTVHAIEAEQPAARLLQIPPGSALFAIERLTRLADGRAVDSEQLQIRADRFALHAVVHRDARSTAE
ncbi:GntR family transcriptional regulator [Flexivirga sp.]|uniref:GntR family transcriptional regulator n=1 Tax=Flexivirga sp. TaxID=1962927 RepID=UPI003F7F2CF4